MPTGIWRAGEVVEQCVNEGAREGLSTYQLDVVDGLLLELLKCPLGLRLQGESEALQRLVLAFHADFRFHLGAGQR